MTRTILLIDDNHQKVDSLQRSVSQALRGRGEVICWTPQENENALERFDALKSAHDVSFVVTDYDLTGRGKLGFFGSAVVDWCQRLAIPVGDYSTRHRDLLGEQANLFEIRVPMASDEIAGRFIASVFLGFDEIRKSYDRVRTEPGIQSPAAALAEILAEPELEPVFSQYSASYSVANSGIMDKMRQAITGVEAKADRISHLMVYVVGHVLLNSVLRYAGPILNRRALAAYLAVDPSSHQLYLPALESCRYGGPFNGLEDFYWTHKVEGFLRDCSQSLPPDAQFESPGAYARARLETALSTLIPRLRECPRCEGEEGGFHCPFTNRTVCTLGDCSVISSDWVPEGAYVTRIEGEYYEEWAPLLGM